MLDSDLLLLALTTNKLALDMYLDSSKAAQAQALQVSRASARYCQQKGAAGGGGGSHLCSTARW